MSRKGNPAKLTEEVLTAVPLWLELGLTVDQIAEMMGVASGSLKVACHKAGISFQAKTSDGLRRSLTAAQWRRLAEEAAARRIPVMQLVADLVGTIADDGLFEAVIDSDHVGERREERECSVQS